MPVQLSKQRVIDREVLRDVADVRLAEANALMETKHFAGAVYLAGYAVECYLKLAICGALRWDALRGMFKTHDLEGLLLYSGFDTDLQHVSEVYESFKKVLALWSVDGKSPESIRYCHPSDIDEATARMFLKCVQDPDTGVVTWLKKMVSD